MIKLRSKYGRDRFYQVEIIKKNEQEEDTELLGKDTNSSRMDNFNFGGESDLKEFTFFELPEFIYDIEKEFEEVKTLSKDQAIQILDRVEERIQFFVDNGLRKRETGLIRSCNKINLLA